ncbi:Integrase, catalytic core [Corchorus capsularis]|uniref:Integrase, catalytic core n=1 Tax=Corchorus capsularis TaxID=210143 RepID=A0A1R3GTE9_COCAP|nr:Integrase, catalytic core [Corchorus capsularis]
MASGSGVPMPPVFTGQNYHLWSVKMKTSLQAHELWEVVDTGRDPTPLRGNPTLAQMKHHGEQVAKQYKALSYIQNSVSEAIFTRILTCETPKEAWDMIREEFQGSDKSRQQQLVTLRRQFEVIRMKEDETIKQYVDKIIGLVNQIKILGDNDFNNKRIVEKIINTLPEKYETKLSALEVQINVSEMSLQELVNSLYSLEQRRASRQQQTTEEAFPAKGKEKAQSSSKKKSDWKKNKNKKEAGTSNNDDDKKKHPLCKHCRRPYHAEKDCWFNPNATCSKCNQKGHVEKVCKNKPQQQQQAQLAGDTELHDEQMFVATCFAGNSSRNRNEWLVDSGCTHHMVHNRELFRNLDLSFNSRVRIGNGDYLEVKGKGDIVVSTPKGNKVITDVFYVPEIDVNLISVGQLLERGYKKSDVAGIFWKFKAWIENQVGNKIKVLRSDNGTECTSDRFEEFLREAGIEHQLTATYTPQQNGVSERKNRTVMEMARRLLFEKQLPKKFWAEAVNTAVYLQNRLLTKAVEGKTPYEALFGKKPSVSHLKVFGCICYVWIPEAKRSKLDEKVEVCIFVGYSNNVKGYRAFNPKAGKVVVSRDVTFNESALLNWERNEAEVPDAVQPSYEQQQTEADLFDDENIDDQPVRGTRPLDDIYQRCSVAVLEPTCYFEASKTSEWVAAMKEELRMIEKNQTWELVDRPQNKNVIGVKWVYRTKLNPDGTTNRLKARLVVKGYAQLYGVDYTETFAPVARLDTIRLLLAIAAQKQWKIHQLDVKSAFLNGYLQEEIFVEQPEGFQVKGNEDKVYLLKKALYGLKQAPRAWYDRINTHLFQIGFCRSPHEPTLYVKQDGSKILIVSLYVDNLLVCGSDSSMVCSFKNEMEKVSEMTDLGEINYFLGMEISQSQNGIFIGQHKFSKEIMKKFHMENCKAVSTPLMSRVCFHPCSGVFAWKSKKQETIAQSTAEAEYIAAAEAVNQAIWLKRLCEDVKQGVKEPVKILVDNQSAIAIAKNPVFHSRTKHFKIKFHYVREMEHEGEISLQYCSSEEQLADILTKPLPRVRYDEEIGPLSPLAVSLAAGFSGSVAAAASHSFDTAKSRSQCTVLPKFIAMERKLLKWKIPGKRFEKLAGIHPADRNLLFRAIWLRMARSGIASFMIVGSYYLTLRAVELTWTESSTCKEALDRGGNRGGYGFNLLGACAAGHLKFISNETRSLLTALHAAINNNITIQWAK